jgi:leucyl aminopeptidase
MNTNLSASVPSQLETDCLVVVVLDRAEKDKGDKEKPVPTVECNDAPVRDAAREAIASGEVTGKPFETTLLHRPAGLKAKRLLLVGGGKAKTFSAAELRKLAGQEHPELCLRPAGQRGGRVRRGDRGRRRRIRRQLRARLLQER